jgi:hypothetical protein
LFFYYPNLTENRDDVGGVCCRCGGGSSGGGGSINVVDVIIGSSCGGSSNNGAGDINIGGGRYELGVALCATAFARSR